MGSLDNEVRETSVRPRFRIGAIIILKCTGVLKRSSCRERNQGANFGRILPNLEEGAEGRHATLHRRLSVSRVSVTKVRPMQ